MNALTAPESAPIDPENPSSPRQPFNEDLERGLQSEESMASGPSFMLYQAVSINGSWSTSYSSSSSKSLDEEAAISYPEKAHISGIRRVHLPPKRREPYELPSKNGPKWYRNFRWLLWTTYKRLFTLDFLANIIVLVGLAAAKRLTFSTSGTATGVNLVASILARQEHVVNILFLVASSLPTWLPLWLRCRAAKVYCYGGVHSGCGIAAVCWYLAFTGYLTQTATQNHSFWPAAGLSYAILMFFGIIIGFAYPTVRTKMHDQFEMTHRFAGWTVVAIVWAQLMTLVDAQRKSNASEASFGRLLIHTPLFWCLFIITGCLFYPWIRLRKRDVYAEKLSDHAIRLHFDYRDLPRCKGVRLSTNPICESHAFATIPAAKPDTGFSCIVSNAGNWTKSLIRAPGERTKIWMKGAPTYGVLRTALIFKRTVIVGTGSGIGPCMSLFHGNSDIHCRILWSTPSPQQTYGSDIVHSVLCADPHAIIYDTRATKERPDMVKMTYQLYRESQAEAVFIVSNPRVTRKLIYGLEARGVPAFAPIFDS